MELRDVWHAVMASWWLVAAATCLGVALLVAFYMTPVYRAEVVMIPTDSERMPTAAVSSLVQEFSGLAAVAGLTTNSVSKKDEALSVLRTVDIVLRDGDELLVPEIRQQVTVIGEVQYPTSQNEPGLSREDYIDRSGGLTRREDDRRIYVVHANGEVVTDDRARWFRRDLGAEIRPSDTIVAPLEIDRVRPLTLWTNVSQIVYSMAIAAAAANSF